MLQIKLLFIEDSDSDIKACQDTVAVYKASKDVQIDLVIVRKVEEAFSKIHDHFDGAIIDLTLDGKANAGNDVISLLKEYLRRIPLVILTGTPDSVDETCNVIKQYKKGGIGYSEIFDLFVSIYKTGLTKILGGRGEIERSMGVVFGKHIMPHWDIWEPHAKNGSNTEKALLRHVLTYLLENLDTDDEPYFEEETYLHPPVSTNLKPGSIIKEKTGSNCYVLLTPACDLASRKGKPPKTERYLVAEIQSSPDSFVKVITSPPREQEKRQAMIEAFVKNNSCGYLHWLPNVKFFQGGFINFRRIEGLNQDALQERFVLPPEIQIAPDFIKNILSRFSSYYARQGQPDLDFQRISKSLCDCLFKPSDIKQDAKQK